MPRTTKITKQIKNPAACFIFLRLFTLARVSGDHVDVVHAADGSLEVNGVSVLAAVPPPGVGKRCL